MQEGLLQALGQGPGGQIPGTDPARHGGLQHHAPGIRIEQLREIPGKGLFLLQ